MLTNRGSAGPIVFALFFVSGMTGLVYQVVWLRQLTLIFGATAYASSAVLSTFMGGLALGSYLAGRRADRWPDPALTTYGKLEMGIAGYATAIPWLLRSATPLLAFAWRHGADRHFAALGLIKFAAIAILILPATTLMGATLPVVSRAAAETARRASAGVGALYAVNTFGAVAGTFLAAFVALPALGMKRTLIANIALNAFVGIVAWSVGRRSDAPNRPESPDSEVSGRDPSVSRTLVLAFAASGFAAMVLEVAWTRGLALVLGSSVYAYASMLTAFLLGLASGAGSAAYYLKREGRADSRLVLGVILGAAGLFSFGGAYAIQSLPRLFGEIYFRVNPSPEGWWLAQIAIALLLMFPTTYALGWVFPLVLDAASSGRDKIASSVGRVYAANTLGTIAGAAFGGFILIPLFGVGSTLVGVAASQLLIGAAILPGAAGATSGRRRVVGAACIAGAIGCFALRPRWDVLMMNSGVYMNVQSSDPSRGWGGFEALVRTNNELLYARDGLTASVLVARQPDANNTYLAVNGKTDASSREDLETQIMLGQLPMLFHRSPRDVLIVGLASGITAGSIATHAVERIRVVEVEAAMLDAARVFAPFNHAVLDDPRVTVSINDARNELQFNPLSYDVIVSEPSNPWMTVASSLFTEEFFRIGRSRLRAGGVFCQWVQMYSLTPTSLKSVLAAFHRVFPHVLVFSSTSGVDLVVLGSDQPLLMDIDEIQRRSSELWVRAELARVGFRGAEDIAAMLQTGEAALENVVTGATVNTDDNGLIEFTAPKALYLDTQDENTALLQGTDGDPLSVVSSLVRTPENPEIFRLEMVRRWLRRQEKLRAGRAVAFFANQSLKSEAEALLRGPK